MKIKTSELIGPKLNWAVAKCEGIKRPYIHDGFCKYGLDFCGNEVFLMYSTDWACGGPIIERERISLSIKHDGWWLAQIYNINDDPSWLVVDHTPLIAAMRCYVASKLGDVIDVPDEIISK